MAALVTGLFVLESCLACAKATAKQAVLASAIRQQDAQVLANTRQLLAQYNADVVAGRPATIPLVMVLRSLVSMIGPPVASLPQPNDSTRDARTKTEYEVLTHVNQEIVQITRGLASSS